MAHLKTLNQRLIQSFTPKVRPLIFFGTSKSSTLENYCDHIPYFSKKLLNFDIPSMKLTVLENKLPALSSPLVGFSHSVIVLNQNLIDDQ